LVFIEIAQKYKIKQIHFNSSYVSWYFFTLLSYFIVQIEADHLSVNLVSY